MDSEYKTLQHNDGNSGVVMEADTIKTIAIELRLILGLHEVQQGGNVTKAYRQGYESFPIKDCVYEEGTTSWNDWWDGYSQAELVSAYHTDGDDE
jgi:hypothetical protein